MLDWQTGSGPTKEVVGTEQDERVRATQLEYDLLQVAPGDLGDGGTGPLGAGQRDAAHPAVGDGPLDLLVRGVDVGVGPGREAGVVEDLLQGLGRLRALGRVLEQDGVAVDQVRAGEPGHLVVGVVPRHDPEEDTERTAAHDGRSLAVEQRDRLVRRERFGVVGVEVVDGGAELDLADGLGDRLAHLTDDDLGEVLDPLGVQLADPTHEGGPLGHGRRCRPRAVRLVRPGDGVPQRVVGDRRVGLDRLAGRRVHHCVLSHSHSCSLSVIAWPHRGIFSAPPVRMHPIARRPPAESGACGRWSRWRQGVATPPSP